MAMKRCPLCSWTTGKKETVASAKKSLTMHDTRVHGNGGGWSGAKAKAKVKKRIGMKPMELKVKVPSAVDPKAKKRRSPARRSAPVVSEIKEFREVFDQNEPMSDRKKAEVLKDIVRVLIEAMF